MIDSTPRAIRQPDAAIRDLVSSADPRVLWNVLISDPCNRVVLYDDEGRVLFANDVFEQAYRRAGRTSVVGLSPNELLADPDAAQEAMAFMQRVRETRSALLVEKIHDGVKHHAHLHPFPDPESDRVFVLVVSRNATTSLPQRTDVNVVKASTQDLGELSSLTKREVEILALIGEGLSSAQIADRLDRSVKTVEWHRASIGSKLAVKSRVELARIAIRAGLTNLADLDEAADPN